ncbi:efflux RND transporter periplasmic adaptor subunit [Rhodospirillum sp. A1_3_36]|uniref:efflux RND transporter periplasmic adaptor subunit n=1 Tax=Rhodospirillum sp. A1_3_36 TaxID=3391666 RepID=UPI0039A71FBF
MSLMAFKGAALAAAASLPVLFFSQASLAQGAPGGAGALPPIPVLTVEMTTVPLRVELTGRTVAYRVAEVRPQVGGIIRSRLFTEGMEVTAGQQLYQIDPATYAAQEKSAEADLARAEASLKSVKAKAARYGELVRVKAVSRQDYEDVVADMDVAQADVLVAQAALDLAHINTEYTKMSAPIAGVIGTSAVTEGALVTANQTTPLAKITQLDPIYVDLTQPAGSLLKTRQDLASGALARDDTPVKVTLYVQGANKAHGQTGSLTFSDVTVDQTTGSVLRRAVFPNPDGLLLPGMFVRAELDLGEQPNVALIPQNVLQRGKDGSASVFVVGEGDKVEVRPVTVDRSLGNQWVVSAGLANGDRVVTAGILKIRPGMKVAPLSDAGKGEGASAPASAGPASASK